MYRDTEAPSYDLCETPPPQAQCLSEHLVLWTPLSWTTPASGHTNSAKSILMRVILCTHSSYSEGTPVGQGYTFLLPKCPPETQTHPLLTELRVPTSAQICTDHLHSFCALFFWHFPTGEAKKWSALNPASSRVRQILLARSCLHHRSISINKSKSR